MLDVTRHFHPVLASEKLRRRPVRVQVAGTPIVLFRDGSRRAAALQDRCPHRFAPLSAGRVRPDGRLACGYHGWHFDATGHGKSPAQPDLVKCDVRSFQVVEKYGYVWVAAWETPATALPALEEDGFVLAGAFSRHFQAPLHVAFDNFSEDEHTPYVHSFLGWVEAGVDRLSFSCDVFDDRTEVHYSAPQRPSPWTRFLLLRPGDVFHNDWVTRFSPIYTIYTLHWSDPKTGAPRPVVAKIPIFFVPETEKTTWLHTFVFAQLKDSRLKPLLPLVRLVAMHVARNEVDDDARWIPTVAGTPESLKGMRLDKYDKPIVHNHRLLSSLYWGDPGASGDPARPTAGVEDASVAR